MSKKTKARQVRASKDGDDIIVFRLLQGRKRMRTMKAFGYGTRHKVWLKIEGLGTKRESLTAESAWFVKEQIAEWIE
jgi:hypothetical protein